MPNIKSAAKRARQALVRRTRNRQEKAKIVTLRRKFFESLKGGDARKCDELYRAYASLLDRCVRKGIVKKNMADRRKQRAAAHVAALAAKAV